MFRSISPSTLVDGANRSVSESYVRSLLYGQSLPYVFEDDHLVLVREAGLLDRFIGYRRRLLGHVGLRPGSPMQILASFQCPLKVRLVGKDARFCGGRTFTDIRVSIWARDEDLVTLDQHFGVAYLNSEFVERR